ncbi:MAG: hypothetical protein QXW97_01180 [Candidatus Pacearchaeota archaeon]
MAEKSNIFSDFGRWHKAFSAANVSLGEIKAGKFRDNVEQNRNGAAIVLKTMAEDKNKPDYFDVEISHIMERGDEDLVNNFVSEGVKLYGEKLKKILREDFDELFSETPSSVKTFMYSAVTNFKPLSDVTSKFEKAVKLHRSLSEIGPNISRYESENSTISDKKRAEEELYEKFEKEIEKEYLGSEDDKKEYGTLVEKLKKMHKQNPMLTVIRFKKIYSDTRKKWEEIVKSNDLKEYIQTILSVESQRQLYGTAILFYEQSENKKRQLKNSDIVTGPVD